MGIDPDRTTVAPVEALPGLSSIGRAIEAATRRGMDQIGRGRMDNYGVEIRVDIGFGRAGRVRIARAAIGQVPRLPGIVRAQRAADLDGRVGAGPE